MASGTPIADRLLELAAARLAVKNEAGKLSERAWLESLELPASTLSVMRSARRKGNECNPTLGTLMTLAKETGASLDYIAYGDAEVSPRLKAVQVARVAGFPEEALQRVLGLEDDPSLDAQVWFLRIEATAAELRATEQPSGRRRSVTRRPRRP